MRTRVWWLIGLMVALLGSGFAQTLVLTNGDVNGDNVVDDADLLSVLFAMGQSCPADCPEDLNGDGIVDDADLLKVLFNMGAQGAPTFAGQVQSPQGAFSVSLTVRLGDWVGSAQQVKVQLKPVGTESDATVPIFEYSASVGGTDTTVPLANLPAGAYTVRAFAVASGRWLRTELSEPLVVPGSAVGVPAAHVPAPSWAEAVIPADSVPSGGAGPSSASRVNLASGEYENTPPADLSVRNPKGPDVAFVRRYSSFLAKRGYASPGLSLGWVHQYDIRVEGVLGSWGALSLVYPNGGRETLTPELVGGQPTGRLIVPAGAPYCAVGTADSVVGRWQEIVVVHRDYSKWVFTPHSVGTGNLQTYRLVRIIDRAGNFISLSWFSDGRLDQIARADGRVLLKCRYSGSQLESVEAYDASGAVYGRVRLEYTNGLLSAVSQITASATAPTRWAYRYRSVGGVPLIEAVATQDPSANTGANQLAWHHVIYSAQGIVQQLVDANRHARTYEYGGGTTTVKVHNASTGQVDFRWTQRIGAKNVNAGVQDASQNSSTVLYQNDYLPTSRTNRNGQTVQLIYDAYGNVQEVIAPRGNRIVYSYVYPDDYPCSPVHQVVVTEYGSDGSAKLPTRYVFYQQTALVQEVEGGYAVAGMLAELWEPKPNLSGGDPNNPNNFVVTRFYYTAQGSLLEVRAPAPNNTPNAFRTTRYFYGVDPYVGYTDPEGERVNMPIAMGVYEGAYNPNAPYANLLYRESWRYDARGNVVAIIRGRRMPNFIGALHLETRLRYNLAGQLEQVVYPSSAGFAATHEYVYRYPGGQLIGIHAYGSQGLERVVLASLGREGEYKAVAQGAQLAAFGYDAQYRVVGQTNGNLHTTNYFYTTTGWVEQKQYPTSFSSSTDRDTYRYEYDAEGNLVKVFAPNNPQVPAVHFVRSPIDSRVEYVDYAGTTPDVVVFYDAFNRCIGLQSSVAAITYTYDDADRLNAVITQYPNQPPLPVEYTYYPDGSLARLRAPYALDPSGNIVMGDYNYEYLHHNPAHGGYTNGPGELVELWTPFVGTPVKTYMTTEGVPYRQEGVKVRSQIQLNHGGLPRSINNTLEIPVLGGGTRVLQLSSFSSIEYNASFAITSMQVNILAPEQNQTVISGNLRFQYGVANRASLVTRETFTPDGNSTFVFGPNNRRDYDLLYPFDAADNPTWLNEFGNPNTFNANGQIVGRSDTFYDANGNALGWFGRTASYDVVNRLLGFGVGLPYNTRPDGQRAFKQGISGLKYFVYDGDRVIFEYEPANRTHRAYAYSVNGLAISSGISAPDNDRRRYTEYAYDPFGRRVHRVDADALESGVVQGIAWYNAYGVVFFDFSPRSNDQYARDSVGYLGQWGYYTDTETVQLIYTRATYYDPARGLRLNRGPNDATPFTGLRLQGDSLAHLCWNTVVATAEAGYLSADPSAPEGLAFLKALEASAGVAQIALEIEGFASLPRALGGLGVGILNAADDLAGGGAALTRGARQAARKADDEWRSLYRSVSLEELDDIEKLGQLRIKFGQMEGKWFTITPGLAARWGKRFYKENPFAIIEVAVPKRVLRQMYYDDKLDGIGPAYYAEQHLLPHIRYIRKLDYIP
jgi:YD repeat-containing protein